MEYLSARQTAEKWKISVRLVQQYCAEGRIQGAEKKGTAWVVPENAEKPTDPRKKERGQDSFLNSLKEPSIPNLMPLMNTPFYPGRCMDYLQSMKKGPKKQIAFAEYYYFSGHPEKAVQEAEKYLTCGNPQLRLSASLIYAFANLSLGEIQLANNALEEIRITLKSNKERAAQIKGIDAFIAATAAILLHLPLPEEMPPAQEFLPLLPVGLRAFALYVEAHYLYLQKNYNKSIGMIEAALTMGAEKFPIPAIYLHLAAVMDYMSLKQLKMAESHLLAAWELARPDDLIEGFGEHHGLLGGMLEAVIKPNWPEDFKRMIGITYRFSSGWRKIHNPVTGHDVAEDLTTTEFAIAMLAARNWTTQEIAKHLDISSNTVKTHVSEAMRKLHIKNRKDLKKYMLQ